MKSCPSALKPTLCLFQIEANFDEGEAAKCLHWIRMMTGVEEISEDPTAIDASHDNFYKLLSDGIILLKSVTSSIINCFC